MKSERLSKRQYAMLRIFVKRGASTYMSIADAQKFDQRPFRSMLVQEWVAYTPGKGFHITRAGIAIYHGYQEDDFLNRSNPSLPLTAYFDVTQYGIKPKRPAVVKAVSITSAA